MNLTKLALHRPVFMLILVFLALFGGRNAYMAMRKEQNPEVQFGVVTIATVYPGAGPDEINTLVTRKVEEAVSGVNGLLEVTGTSQEGVSVVVCQFEIGTNIDVAINDVRTKVDAITGTLPRDITKPVVDKNDTTGDPVLNLVVTSDRFDAQQLRDLVDNKLKDRFSQVPGVSRVAIVGGDLREIQVQVRADKLLAYGLGILDVQRAVQAATLNVPSGRIVKGDQETSVRVLGEFKTVAEMQETLISVQDAKNPQAKGAIVRLGDIADIKDTVAERRSNSRLDGTDSLTLIVQKAREGNAILISDKIRNVVIPELEKDYGLKFVVPLDQSTLIKESLFDVNLTIFIGIVLVTAIVYIFLHDWRGTLIVAVAIPVCVFATFLVIRALGFTINSLSLLAIALSVGVLVDDAIVVLENIYRHLRMGEEPMEAAINGRNEIGLAALAITLADVVVFLPVGFMGGVVGQFFRPLGITFAVAVVISLFVSFTITPLMAARWYKKGEDVEANVGRFGHWFDRRFTGLENRYKRILEWSLNHRWFVFIAGYVILVCVFMVIAGGSAKDAGVAFATGLGLWKPVAAIATVSFIINLFRKQFKPMIFVQAALWLMAFPLAALIGFQYAQWKGGALFGFQFFPASDTARVSVQVQLPPGSSLAATTSVVETVEQRIKGHEDVKYMVTRVGQKGGGFSAADQGTNFAQIDAALYDKAALLDRLAFWVKHPERLRSRADTAVAADIIERVGRVAGAQLIISTGQAQGFGSPIQMSFRGDDRAKILEAAERIRAAFEAGRIKGVILPDVSSKEGKPEIRAIPDRARMADAGVTTAELATAMRTLYEGNTDSKFRVNGLEYNIRVMMALDDRNNPDLVQTVPIRFVNGAPVYVDSIADVRSGAALDKIDRRSRQEEVRITAELLPGFAAGNVQAEIDNWIKSEGILPEGVIQKNLGQADVQAREMGYLMGAIGLGFILVYCLLASLYNNLLYPFIIQLAQPQALVGALLALVLTNKQLNIVGFIGLIALVGLVGKNAILVVDYTNTLRERGMNRHDALVLAGPTRLRPIMMTTLAILLGMLPVALAIGRGSEFRETIGISIFGGILLSTILTLVVIPCSYTIFDDLSNWLGGKLRRKAPSTEPSEPVEA